MDLVTLISTNTVIEAQMIKSLLEKALPVFQLFQVEKAKDILKNSGDT